MLRAQRTIWALALLVGAFFYGFAGLGFSQEPPQIPQGQTREQPLAQQEGQSPPTSSGTPQIGTPSERQHGSEEGTEFWPLFFGYRLKITDTLIALFTAGLFVATWWLYRATRNLGRVLINPVLQTAR
jgi:hypothetical protein